MELLEQVKQTLRVSLSNPYDILSNNIGEDFKGKIENFYRNLPNKNYMVFTPNPFELSEIAKKVKEKSGIEVVSKIDEYWESLKIWEYLTRVGDVGKNSEFLKIADIFQSELNTLYEELKHKLKRTKDIEEREKLIKELRRAKDYEKAIFNLIEFRRQKVEEVFSILREKDQLIDLLADETLKIKLLKPLEENPLMKSALMEEIENFGNKLIENYRKALTTGKDITLGLDSDKRFKNFLESIEGIKEKAWVNSSTRHRIFIQTLLQLEDSLFNRLKKELEKFLDEVDDSIKGEKGLENKIKRWELIKEKIGDKNLKRDLDKLIEVYTLWDKEKKAGKSLFLGNYGGGFFELIEKYYNYSRDSHNKLIKSLISLYNTDLTIWKIYRQSITPKQLEGILNSKEIGIDIKPTDKENLVEFYQKRVQGGKNLYDYYLDPLEYSNLIKAIHLKTYAYELYKLKEKPPYQPLLNHLKEFENVKNFEEFKSLLKTKEKDLAKAYDFLLMGAVNYLGRKIIGLKSEKLADCIEQSLLSEDFDKRVDNCYKRIIEEVKVNAERMQEIVKSKLTFSINGVIYAPVLLSLMLYYDIQRGILEIHKEKYKEKLKEANRDIEELVFGIDNPVERDRYVREFGFNRLGFWSEISETPFVLDKQNQIYAFRLERILPRIMGEKVKWEGIIKALADRINASKDDKEIKEDIANELIGVNQKKDEAILSAILTHLDEAIDKVEFKNTRLKSNFKKAINQIRTSEGKDIRGMAIANLVNLIKGLEGKTDDEKYLLSVLREIDRNITYQKLLNDETVKDKLKEAVLNGVKNSNSPAEFFNRLKTAKYKGEILKGKADLGEDLKKEIDFEIGKYIYPQVVNDLDDELQKMKKNTIVIENPDSNKSLILLFNELSEEDKELLEYSRDKFLLKEFGLTEDQIKRELSKDFHSGMEYKFLIDNYLKMKVHRDIEKEKSIRQTPKHSLGKS